MLNTDEVEQSLETLALPVSMLWVGGCRYGLHQALCLPQCGSLYGRHHLTLCWYLSDSSSTVGAIEGEDSAAPATVLGGKMRVTQTCVDSSVRLWTSYTNLASHLFL